MDDCFWPTHTPTDQPTAQWQTKNFFGFELLSEYKYYWALKATTDNDATIEKIEDSGRLSNVINKFQPRSNLFHKNEHLVIGNSECEKF